MPCAGDDEYLHGSTPGDENSMMQPVLCRRRSQQGTALLQSDASTGTAQQVVDHNAKPRSLTQFLAHWVSVALFPVGVAFHPGRTVEGFGDVASHWSASPEVTV